MKKLLGIVVLGLLWFNISNAEIFNFEKVYMCGPKKISYDEQYKSRGWYYTIHLDKNERFIISLDFLITKILHYFMPK